MTGVQVSTDAVHDQIDVMTSVKVPTDAVREHVDGKTSVKVHKCADGVSIDDGQINGMASVQVPTDAMGRDPVDEWMCDLSTGVPVIVRDDEQTSEMVLGCGGKDDVD